MLVYAWEIYEKMPSVRSVPSSVYAVFNHILGQSLVFTRQFKTESKIRNREFDNQNSTIEKPKIKKQIYEIENLKKIGNGKMKIKKIDDQKLEIGNWKSIIGNRKPKIKNLMICLILWKIDSVERLKRSEEKLSNPHYGFWFCGPLGLMDRRADQPIESATSTTTTRSRSQAIFQRVSYLSFPNWIMNESKKWRMKSRMVKVSDRFSSLMQERTADEASSSVWMQTVQRSNGHWTLDSQINGRKDGPTDRVFSDFQTTPEQNSMIAM